jgi:hypothetical protein
LFIFLLLKQISHDRDRDGDALRDIQDDSGLVTVTDKSHNSCHNFATVGVSFL